MANSVATVDYACQSTNQTWSQRNCLSTSETGLFQAINLWQGTEKHSAALKVPMNTVAAIIRKWKKIWTSRTLPRAVRQSKLSNRGRRALVRKVTKNPMVTQSSICEERRMFQKDNHGVARQKLLLNKRHMGSLARVCRKAHERLSHRGRKLYDLMRLIATKGASTK